MVHERKHTEATAARRDEGGRRTFMIALVLASAVTVMALAVIVWLRVDEQALKPPLPAAKAPQAR